jgi:hypothetical protein
LPVDGDDTQDDSEANPENEPTLDFLHFEWLRPTHDARCRPRSCFGGPEQMVERIDLVGLMPGQTRLESSFMSLVRVLSSKLS